MAMGTAQAQTDAQRIADLQRKLQSALKVIDKLSDKVDRLENGGAAAASALSTDKTQKPADSVNQSQPNSSVSVAAKSRPYGSK